MTISKEHRANIEAAIKETEYKYFGMYEFTEAQHNAVDLLVSVAQAMLDDDAALESRVLATHLATEQKAALDLAVLNIKTHGDDQLLSAVQPLIEFYESRVLAERKQEPVAWRSKWKTGNQWTYSNSKPYCNPPEKFDVEPLFAHPTPDDASETYREVGVWDTDGRKFRTYAAENLNGKAMYVRDAAMQADKETK
jgi:hypothetical protein